MCGIYGSFSRNYTSFDLLSHRGRDSSNLILTPQGLIGHHLHATNGYVKQPFIDEDNWLTINCEIYNWEELAKKYKVTARNDSDLAWKLLLKYGIKIIEEFRGPYALAFFNGNLYLARDKKGIFPLYFGDDGFASERLPKMRELHPYHMIVNHDMVYRGRLKKEGKPKKLEDALRESVKFRAHEDITLFLSGIDSALLAYYLKDEGFDFKAITVGLPLSLDLTRGKKLAEKLKLKSFKTIEIDKVTAKNAVEFVSKKIHSSDPVKIEVGLVTFFASQNAGKTAISGLGADELFGGYARMHRSLKLENKWALQNIYERSTYRDNVLGLVNGTEIRMPYLDEEVIHSSLSLSEEDVSGKKALRDLARPILGNLSNLPKKAAQYGSNFSSVIKKPKTVYLKKFATNRPVAALISGGKDSWYSAYTMNRLNYPIACAIVMQPKSDESWMFQSQGVKETPQLIQELGIHLIIQETSGKKEEELKDLEVAMKKAMTDFGAEGIVSGAISSEYQRDRIENLAGKVGLASYAPLWGTDQEAYLRRVVREGFGFRIVHAAADGLDAKEWVGKEVTETRAEELIQLSKKHKFNAAGEGGEFETLVFSLPKGFKPLK